MKTLVLLTNIGSPASVSTNDVRVYLEEFLMDPMVINMPTIARWILVKLIIGPLRSKKSANKYKSIWTEKGSPLIVNSQNFEKKLQNILGGDYLVRMGYRYGTERIDSVLKSINFENINKIIYIPMFPQFADATTQTSIDFFNESLEKLIFKNKTQSSLNIEIISSFCKEKFFIDSWVENINSHLEPNHLVAEEKHILFSFHGLPESQIRNQAGCELMNECCAVAVQTDKNCYRAHCIYTAHEIAKGLGLSAQDYSICFQSRLGKAKWLQPYTSEMIKDLYQRGKKNLVVVSPAFVVDCLETLEELGVELRAEFMRLDSKNKLQLIPSLNDSNQWLVGFAKMLKSK